jgi:hypothetical protein
MFAFSRTGYVSLARSKGLFAQREKRPLALSGTTPSPFSDRVMHGFAVVSPRLAFVGWIGRVRDIGDIARKFCCEGNSNSRV